MKTYSEQRQAILFKASRDMRRVAGQVLHDVQQDAEFTGGTYAWAKALAKRTAETANELERQGHEETIASGQAEAALRSSHALYSNAIDLFERRLEAAQAREGERI